MARIETPEDLGDLLFKYMGRQLNADEIALLKTWLDESPDGKQLFEERTSVAWIAGKLETLDRVTSPDKSSKMLRLLADALQKQAGNVPKPGIAAHPFEHSVEENANMKPGVLRRYGKYFSVAALFLLIAITAGIFFFNRKESTSSTAQITEVKIQPGKDAATLQLADGSIMALDQHQSGKLADQGNMKILADSGQLAYRQGNAVAGNGTALFNKLSTARGQQFSLRLSDGSVVYLNAQSSVRFPVAFGSQERSIEVSGEVYMEVAKDSRRPFRVQTGTHSIEVLGTSFNVNAYPDEKNIVVTLNEGAIKVDQTPLQKAGLQARISPDGGVQVVPVDMDEAIAWKNGLFLFRDTDMRTVMRQLSRWYDMDAEFEDNIQSHFNASIKRDEPITEILRLLEMTNEVHFSIKDKKVIVRR